MSRMVGRSVMKAMIAHLGATERTHQRKDFVDAGEQQRPGIAGGAAVSRFGGGSAGVWVAGWSRSARAVTAGRSGELGTSTPK